MNQLVLRPERRVGTILGAGVALLALCALFFAVKPSSANAWNETQFCWGATVGKHNGPSNNCYYIGYAPKLYAIWATGDKHSVCADDAWKISGYPMCTAGPGDSVYNGSFNGSAGRPRIVNQGETTTTVWGRFWWLPEEGGGGGGENPPPPPPPASWHSENFGGVGTSDPEVCSWGMGHIEIFVRGTDNALWHKHWNGSFWSNWENMGGTLASAPGCVSWGTNRVDVVARATNNTIQHWYWNGASWQSDNLGGNITNDPDIASWGVNRLDIFGRAPDGSITHKWWGGSSWSGWETLGAPNSIVSGVGAVGSGGNRIDVVGRAPNNSVYHLYYLGGWYTENFGGIAKGDPDMSSWGAGVYDVWMRGTDDGLWHKWWMGTKWSDWERNTPGSLAASPGAVSFQQGRHDIVTLDANGGLVHWWWQ